MPVDLLDLNRHRWRMLPEQEIVTSQIACICHTPLLYRHDARRHQYAKPKRQPGVDEPFLF